ncbi:DUF2569 family protein [Escherichia coli]
MTALASTFNTAAVTQNYLQGQKIRGWLYLPAIGLVLTILANMISINFTIRFLMENIAQVGHAQKRSSFLNSLLSLVFFSMGCSLVACFFVKSVNCRITILHLLG